MLCWDRNPLTWMVNLHKFRAVMESQGFGFILRKVESNPIAIQEQGAEQEQVWLLEGA